ncbi:tRNA dimethylallyltransferase 2 isoform X2 [Diospyros lotus]|uniref:tRNA dimethylallyltransferase 2 isoform X2 n=1 Tax=Diospyros lotus TaxID=55363 RepID=UPI0022574828|nr:tRNA dimethylallyltransferase 2 isoform X2 [Diospyros lotus]
MEEEEGSETQRMVKEKAAGGSNERGKPKVVVIMGPTGSGKSRLAIDLASHFPLEIINADSMQVYRGLDVLTNKVPLQDQKGVPHHLLGTVSPNLEFTAKDFRDSAIRLIEDILSRNCVPIIVGGTNYYIQALMTPFLLDDSLEDMDEYCPSDCTGDKQQNSELESGLLASLSYDYDCLKDLDPAAANRIHPNDQRKINQYLSLYGRYGVLPSKLLQGKAMENWGRAQNFRYNCCFICVDASLPVLDKYVEQRVDRMVEAGLLDEVFDIYNLNMDYTRGLRQAIGVREFEDFLKAYLFGGQNGNENGLNHLQMWPNKDDQMLKENMTIILNSLVENQLNVCLKDAIDKVKINTRRLVRRQKRRLNRLQMLFGWNINYVDATESLCATNDSWAANVVEPSSGIIRSFLSEAEDLVDNLGARTSTEGQELIQRDLWTQYVCKACGNRVLRGGHEWEQHKQGRAHRKRISRLKKSGCFIE